MKILVLGSGLVGAPMAVDLVHDHGNDVTVADKNKAAFKKLTAYRELKKIVMDLSEPANVKKLVRHYDLVVNALPGFMGFRTLKAVIEAGKNIVDISFFPEDPFILDPLAKKKGVTAIMDCGVAPGMCNILIGYAAEMLDKTENVVYYVGGLPVVREWPYEYKAVFSPVDVIEEYTRPARFMENGKEVIKPALSDPELMNFPMVGTLEAFNTDGLRSLVKTIKAPNMKEKTLRYPGHIEKMAMLRDTGFFSTSEIRVGKHKIRPMDLTAKLLFPKWELREGEDDITLMKVIVEGQKKGKKIRYTWDLFDTYDPLTEVHSMARTTGYTATTAVRMLQAGLFSRKGLIVPEYIGKYPECVKFMLKGLRDRGIVYEEKVETLNG